jgi:competence protein ComEA
VTKEERNVLLFVALGIGIGFLPERERTREAEHRQDAPEVVFESSAETPDSALAGSTASPTFVASEPTAVARDLYPIDVNRAGAELLEELPGIGPSKARAILDERAARGPFKGAEDLTRVRGIGPGTVRRFQGLITFGGPDSGSSKGDSTLGDGTAGSSLDRARDPERGSARSGEEAAEVHR